MTNVFVLNVCFSTYLKCHNPNSFSAFCQKHIHNIIAKEEENQVNYERLVIFTHWLLIFTEDHC